mgnify:CR=1 FL=1|jgi:hypothetical protein
MSREAFEVWAKDRTFILSIQSGSGYLSVREMAWEVWQAAQAQCIDGMVSVPEHLVCDCYVDKAAQEQQ